MKRKELFYQLLTICLVAAVIGSFVKISGLKSDIRLLQHSLSNETSRLETQISSIYDNVDERLKKQASLFSSAEREFGALDAETKMANVEFSVVPKIITPNMKVNVSVGDSTIEMTKADSGEFSADVPVGLFAEYDSSPLVTIVSDGETKTEYLESLGVSNIWAMYLPTMVNGSGYISAAQASLYNGELTVDGHLYIGYYLAELNKDTKFIKYTLITEVDGEETVSKDITDIVEQYEKTDDIEDGVVDIKFNETYDLYGGNELAIYLVAEDSLGFIHKKNAFHWSHPEDDSSAKPEAALYEGEVILDKAGNELYGRESY